MSTVVENINQAKSDLLGCKAAIIAKGVEIPSGTPTSDYAEKIGAISSGITVNESYDISEGVLGSATIELEGGVVATIPDGVVTIGKTAFKENAVITKVVMPDSVETIEDGKYYGTGANGAFYSCANLKIVEFSNFLTSIGSFTFSDCTSLTSITIPDSVTTIGISAFGNCTSLTSITIPNSIISIGGNAFVNCTSLTSITIPNSVTSIEDGTFVRCTSLTSITIPNSIISIGGSAFVNCISLTSITIPDSVTTIGRVAFVNCTSLTDIYYTGTQAEWEAITGISDAGIPETATIHYEYTPMTNA